MCSGISAPASLGEDTVIIISLDDEQDVQVDM